MIDEVTRKVIKVIAEQVRRSESQVKLDARLYEDLDFDWLDGPEVAMVLEEEFELIAVEISQETQDGWKTVQDIVDTVMQFVEAKKLPS